MVEDHRCLGTCVCKSAATNCNIFALVFVLFVVFEYLIGFEFIKGQRMKNEIVQGCFVKRLSVFIK